MTDSALLQHWVDRHDEDAFRDLVARHAGLVHATAARRLGGDSALAQDAAQRVFTILARKAPSLLTHPCLAAWLHRAALLESAQLARQEAGRARRLASLAAHTSVMISADESPAPWRDALPEIDLALESLPASDRQALLLRHLEGRPFPEIARLLGKNEAAVRKQTTRALEKLAALLRRRGVLLPVALIATALGTGLGQAAPAPLAAGLATAAIAGAKSISTTQVLLHSLRLMFYGKSTTTLAAAAVLALTCLTGSFALGRHQAAASSRLGLLVSPPAQAATGREKIGPPPLRAAPGSTAAATPDHETRLRSQLDGIASAFTIDVKNRSLNVGGGPPKTGLMQAGMSSASLEALADFQDSDLDQALRLLPEYRFDPKKFQTLAGFLFSALLTRDPAPAVLARLSQPDYLIDGHPALFAVVSALDALAKTDPVAAWRWQKNAVDTGLVEIDPKKPADTAPMARWLGRDPAAALEDLRQLPPQWESHARRALRESFQEKETRDRLLSTLETTADDRLALLIAGCQPHKGNWTPEKLLPWLLTRTWEKPDGLDLALHSLLYEPGGGPDKERIAMLLGAVGKMPTAAANDALLRAVRPFSGQ